MYLRGRQKLCACVSDFLPFLKLLFFAIAGRRVVSLKISPTCVNTFGQTRKQTDEREIRTVCCEIQETETRTKKGRETENGLRDSGGGSEL